MLTTDPPNDWAPGGPSVASVPADPSIDKQLVGAFTADVDASQAASLNATATEGGSSTIKVYKGSEPFTAGAHAVVFGQYAGPVMTDVTSGSYQYSVFARRSGLDVFTPDIDIDGSGGTNLWYFLGCPAAQGCSVTSVDPLANFAELETSAAVLVYGDAIAWLIPIAEVGDDTDFREGAFVRNGDTETAPASFDIAPDEGFVSPGPFRFGVLLSF